MRLLFVILFVTTPSSEGRQTSGLPLSIIPASHDVAPEPGARNACDATSARATLRSLTRATHAFCLPLVQVDWGGVTSELVSPTRAKKMDDYAYMSVAHDHHFLGSQSNKSKASDTGQSCSLMLAELIFSLYGQTPPSVVKESAPSPSAATPRPMWMQSDYCVDSSYVRPEASPLLSTAPFTPPSAKKAAAANMHVVLRAGGDDTIEAEDHPSPTSILASSHPPPACRDTLPAAYQGGRRKNLAQTDFPEFQDFGFLAHW